MEIRELSVPGAFEVTTKHFPDSRGIFLEAYKSSEFEKAVGHKLELRQANISVSKAGTVRGIHFADVAPSQAKYVMCPKGAILDFAVDIRVGSPTFGQYDSVLLNDTDRNAIYLSEGLGHVFIALEDDSVALYLCNAEFNPGREHGISPLDKDINLPLPETARDGSKLELLLSEKDTAAPTLAEAKESGLLPSYEDAKAFIHWLDE